MFFIVHTSFCVCFWFVSYIACFDSGIDSIYVYAYMMFRHVYAQYMFLGPLYMHVYALNRDQYGWWWLLVAIPKWILAFLKTKWCFGICLEPHLKLIIKAWQIPKDIDQIGKSVLETSSQMVQTCMGMDQNQVGKCRCCLIPLEKKTNHHLVLGFLSFTVTISLFNVYSKNDLNSYSSSCGNWFPFLRFPKL